jgi:hypothetical protein
MSWMTPNDALADLAAMRAGSAMRAVEWFDGFWDFFVPNRDALETVPSIAVCGSHWLALYWEPAGGPRLDLFVESKDRRPGARAPAPVASIDVATGDALAIDATPARTIDADTDARLRALGAEVAFGYWGLHARCAVARADALVAIFDLVIHAAARS